MKRIVAAVAFVLGLAFLLNCGGSTPEAKKIKIGVSFATLAEERWSREKDLMEQYARELGATLAVQTANGDENAQNAQIENLVTQGVDVLIIIAQNGSTAVTGVAAAKREGIPSIAYDRNIPSKDLALYMSFDNVKIGERQAAEIVKLVPQGRFLWLGGSPTDDNARLVREGHMRVLQPLIDAKKVTLVTEQWCDGWSPQEALKHTENALTANQNKIDAVIASNDGTAGGAVQALAAQNLAGKVPVPGQDAELAACQRIAEGTQTVSIFKDVRVLARESIKAAVELAQKKKPSAVNAKVKDVDAVLLDVVPVTKANLMEVIVTGGFHKKEDVYKRVPKEQWPK